MIPRFALSVRQPWAHCLVMGWKPVENRNWRAPNPGLKFRGPFAIHASKGMTRDEYEGCAELCEDLGFACPPPADLLRGGIVGMATIVDVVKEFDSPWFFGPRGLVIADARPVDFIAVGGRLGFFEWEPLLPFRGSDSSEAPAKWMLPAKAPAQNLAADAQGSLL